MLLYSTTVSSLLVCTRRPACSGLDRFNAIHLSIHFHHLFSLFSSFPRVLEKFRRPRVVLHDWEKRTLCSHSGGLKHAHPRSSSVFTFFSLSFFLAGEHTCNHPTPREGKGARTLARRPCCPARRARRSCSTRRPKAQGKAQTPAQQPKKQRP